MTQATATPTETQETGRADRDERVTPSEKPRWETPEMQDVSEQVMAQPYIRFT
jgi:hypothetical protein